MTKGEIPIDWEKVNDLLIAGCTGVEVADFFGMHRETFYDRVMRKLGMPFSEYKAILHSKGDALIREAQFKKALKKQDNVMLIWLGKQRLGQKETPSTDAILQNTAESFNAIMAQLNQLQKPFQEASAKPVQAAESAETS